MTKLNRQKTSLIVLVVLGFSFAATRGTPTGDSYLFSGRAAMESLTINYHVGHTVVLWPVYHLLPKPYQMSVRPAGFVSLICGVIVCLLLYQLGIRMGFNNQQASAACLIYCCAPGPLYWSIVGEQYSLQLLLNLVFVHLFMCGHFLKSVIVLMASALVSPIAVFGSALVFVVPGALKKIRQLILVAIVSGLFYFLFIKLCGIKLDLGMRKIVNLEYLLSFGWLGLLRFALVILGNFGVALAISFWNRNQSTHLKLPRSIVLLFFPYLVLAVVNSEFTMQLGSFLLAAFVGLALYLSRYVKNLLGLVAHIAVSVGIAFLLLIVPGNALIKEYKLAADKISALKPRPAIYGAWDVTFPIILEAVNWDVLEAFSHYAGDKNCEKILTKNIVLVESDTNSIFDRVKRFLGISQNNLLVVKPGWKVVYTGSFLSVSIPE